MSQTASTPPPKTEKKPATVERTFQYDDSLPRLPVPELADTFAGLRESVAVVAKSADELAEYDAAAAEAISQLGNAQAVLKERAANQKNYIGPWWTGFAYLRNRFPNVLNTNVFSVRDSDFDALGGPNPLSHDPIVRAALMARESLEFRKIILKEALPVEKFAGKAPMCMRQYKLYWTTRVPGREIDSIYAADVSKATRVAVMHRGAIFFMTVIDSATQEELNVAEMVEVMRLGFSKIRPPPPDDCVGYLTAADRKSWAVAWAELEKRSENNRKILDGILNCITMVSIDDEPVTTLKEGINQASHLHAHNRWFDRSSLRIVSSNGICLEHGDHTAMDAIVMASTPVDLMAKLSRDFVQDGSLARTTVRSGFDASKHLEMANWDLTPSIRTMIKAAREAHVAACQGIEIDCFTYLGFGRDALRNAKINSDAFVQQVLQLAFYRDRGYATPVYETASTRLFQEGRTDTIRSLTAEQLAFVKAFDDSKIPVAQKQRLFAAALKRHADVTTRSSTGKGYDRHLLALRIAQAHVLSKPIPKLFDLPAVVNAGSFQLLTSQMVGRYFVGGFAHVLDDGYGCCYYLRRNAVCVVVSCCSRAGLTNIDRFQKHLTRAFHDVAALAMSASGSDINAPAPAAKKAAKL